MIGVINHQIPHFPTAHSSQKPKNPKTRKQENKKTKQNKAKQEEKYHN